MADPAPRYLARLADRPLAELLLDFPAVLVSGARATGKTTTAARVARETVRLDVPAQAAAFRADPDAALRQRGEPLLIDEWQEVPEILAAVKRAVDADPRPGRFVLTGSVRGEIDNVVWPGTGRLVQLTMNPLTRREIGGLPQDRGSTFLERLAGGTSAAFRPPERRPDLRDYVELALAGAFPDLTQRETTERRRRIWLAGYLEQLLTRDGPALAPGSNPGKLRGYLEAIALNSAGTPEHKTLLEAAGVAAETGSHYDSLLERLFVTERVPAWTHNRLKRLVLTPKRYVIEPALAAASAGLTPQTVLDDGDLLGRCLDTFAMAQLRAETDLEPPGDVRRHHLRTKGGEHEVDIVVELPGRRVMGIEVKAAAAVGIRDARHLIWLREQLGDAFVAGAILHTGPDAFVLDGNILALPLWAFWT